MNHPTAWNLIPWFVNGRAPERDREALEAHLAQCLHCRAEVEAQRSLMNAMQTTPVVESMPHASLQRLWQRIDAAPAVQPALPPRMRQTRLVGWLAAAVAVEALLLGTLSTVVYHSRQVEPAPAEFRTVTSAPATPATPGVRAVFSPAMTLGELQALLADARLKIEGGPTEDGVYTLATLSPVDDPRQSLKILRAHPASRFAEPIGP
ncbi:MAG: zf-HC2 domain-containing protein [Pseudomonadota bacterium]